MPVRQQRLKKPRVPRLVSRFGSDERGAIAIMGALLMPVMVGAMGLAIDYTLAVRDRAVLQLVSDTTALAVARELAIARPNAARVQSIGHGIATEELRQRNLSHEATITTAVQSDQASVKVDVQRPRRAFFAAFTGGSPGVLGASAVANLSGRRKICVVALDQSSASAIEMKSNSWLTADNCDVFSNSVSRSGVTSDSGIRVSASLTCSSGGFSGAGDFRGEKLSDCPPVRDPLESRAAPSGVGCTANNLKVIDKGSAGARHVLRPGTYCGGLFIGGNSVVQLQAGVYVIKDGPLVVDSNADVSGIHVGFYLSGEKAVFQFLSNAKVWLDAPRDGALAGLLFYEDRGVSLNRLHEIKSNYVSNLTGTIYLPRGRFVVDATNDVAEQSAFTVIVVRQMLLTANPKLVVNSDYGITDVPVPKGLGPVDGPVRLLH